MNLLRRLWEMSPRDFNRAVARRIGLARTSPAACPGWHRVASGPVAGANLYLAPEAVDTWQAMVAGTHDQFLFDAAKLRQPLVGSVCWDVGAHFGYHSLAFAALAGSGGRVVAFEPNPANLSRMTMNLERNPDLAGRIAVKSIALSDRAGTAEFRFSDHVESGMSTGGHLTSATAPKDSSSYRQFQPMQVETDTIDGLVGSGQVSAPDLIKIDVEGAEADVLKGGREVIGAHRPLLLIEVHHILQMFEVQQLLAEWGYCLEVLDREHATSGRCFLLGGPGIRG